MQAEILLPLILLWTENHQIIIPEKNLVLIILLTLPVNVRQNKEIKQLWQ